MRKLYYIATQIRGFIDIDVAVNQLQEEPTAVNQKFLTTKVTKDMKYDCAFTDGETNMIIGIEVLKIINYSGEPYVMIALDTPTTKRKYYQRRILELKQEKLVRHFVNPEVFRIDKEQDNALTITFA